MTDIEIPYVKDRSRRYRFFEKLPGMVSWTILIAPLIMSIFSPIAMVYALIIYLLIWFAKAISTNIRVLQGWRVLQAQQKLDWPKLLEELDEGQVLSSSAKRPKWHHQNLLRLQTKQPLFKPSQVYNAVIIASYNEGMEVLEPTVQSVLNSSYDMERVILLFAYEARDGAQSEEAVLALIKKYGSRFKYAAAIKHPLTEGEVRGKGGNINYAGKALLKYVTEQNIDPMHVNVTTLDSDNRPHPSYFAALTYTFAVSPDPLHTSYQPIALYTQNIWDVPAPMRVIATGNSFFQVVASMRTHALRNFSAHAQPLASLIGTNFWSARTIVEDGHQFWRSYFAFDGKYEVYPIFVPIYQDAVLSATFRRTLVAQFIQLRRWAWGCSDIAYVAEMGFFHKNKINKFDLVAKFWRLFEGHISWATASLLILGAAFIPAFIHPNSYAANQLPIVASRIQTVALAGIVVTLFLSFIALPPRPARYKRHRSLFMILQWVYMPLTAILYNGMAGLYSQTRLMFGKYMDKFDVTAKAVASDKKK